MVLPVGAMKLVSSKVRGSSGSTAAEVTAPGSREHICKRTPRVIVDNSSKYLFIPHLRLDFLQSYAQARGGQSGALVFVAVMAFTGVTGL